MARIRVPEVIRRTRCEETRGAGRCGACARGRGPVRDLNRARSSVGDPRARRRTACRQHTGCPIRWAPSRRPMARIRVPEVIRRTRCEETRGAGRCGACARGRGPVRDLNRARSSVGGPRARRRTGLPVAHGLSGLTGTGQASHGPDTSTGGDSPDEVRRGPRRWQVRPPRTRTRTGCRGGASRSGGTPVRSGAETPEAVRRPGRCERTFRRYIERCGDEGLDARVDKRMHRVPAHRAPVDEGGSDPRSCQDALFPMRNPGPTRIPRIIIDGSSAAPIRARTALLPGEPSDAAAPQRPEVVKPDGLSPISPRSRHDLLHVVDVIAYVPRTDLRFRAHARGRYRASPWRSMPPGNACSRCP